MDKLNYHSIDHYIACQDSSQQSRLQEIRSCIHEIIPEAVELISYQMPAFKWKGKIVAYFGAFKEHISLFPHASCLLAFQSYSKEFKMSKGTIQFPMNKELPLSLIQEMIRFRMQEMSIFKNKK
ncbi:iron chaperone [Aquirufa rosea]|uniref:YdhG-like domain-containing protein n=1 Tax=Aquirufa rosea TaxID=2509241 RepID=A0A4Q1C2I3_9BACT|nr:DUF1801 domain-containing protein [Aquirufa rosea]RXK52396.1 hypothetical protein ESB04_01735 [Aquirufa rosea]